MTEISGILVVLRIPSELLGILFFYDFLLLLKTGMPPGMPNQALPWTSNTHQLQNQHRRTTFKHPTSLTMDCKTKITHCQNTTQPGKILQRNQAMAVSHNSIWIAIHTHSNIRSSYVSTSLLVDAVITSSFYSLIIFRTDQNTTNIKHHNCSKLINLWF